MRETLCEALPVPPRGTHTCRFSFASRSVPFRPFETFAIEPDRPQRPRVPRQGHGRSRSKVWRCQRMSSMEKREYFSLAHSVENLFLSTLQWVLLFLIFLFFLFFFTYSTSIGISHTTKQQSASVVPAVLIGTYNFSVRKERKIGKKKKRKEI